MTVMVLLLAAVQLSPDKIAAHRTSTRMNEWEALEDFFELPTAFSTRNLAQAV